MNNVDASTRMTNLFVYIRMPAFTLFLKKVATVKYSGFEDEKYRNIQVLLVENDVKMKFCSK